MLHQRVASAGCLHEYPERRAAVVAHTLCTGTQERRGAWAVCACVHYDCVTWKYGRILVDFTTGLFACMALSRKLGAL
jgi:hypothetical protein